MKALSHEVELLEPLPSPPGRKIWRGRQLALGRLVEVVTLADGVLPTSPHARQALAEARAHSLLRHPSIREVYALEVNDSSLTIEREAVQGEALDSALPGLDSERRRVVVCEIAKALAHAQAKGVIHGDLSLERVLVAADGSVKVDGFSFVLEVGAQAVPADAISGAGLRAPEVRLGAAYGALAEEYVFGCLAYEILTGDRLGEAPRLSKKDSLWVRAPDLPPLWAELLGQCLEPIAAARPPSFTFLSENLQAATAAQLMPSVRPQLGRRGSNAWLLGLLGILALGLAGGLGYGLHKNSAPGGIQLSVVPLETDSSRQKALIRVVARPWAHVFLDGEFYDTTPFAAPISVEPGLHTLRFEHPQAGAEERSIQVGVGQTALVDVALRLTKPVFLDPELDRPKETSP